MSWLLPPPPLPSSSSLLLPYSSFALSSTALFTTHIAVYTWCVVCDSRELFYQKILAVACYVCDRADEETERTNECCCTHILMRNKIEFPSLFCFHSFISTFLLFLCFFLFDCVCECVRE